MRENININSSHQLLSILVGLYGLIDLESTNEKILKDIKDREIVPYILDYREHNKKITTYGEDFLKHIHPVTGRVHSEFLQNGCTSGRMSSTSPNLQNIPKEKRYRMPFKAPEGKKLITFDYSQMELRLAGAVSKDPVIINAYVNNKDIHATTASLIFNKKLEDTSKEERNLGKTINFGVLYGSTAYGLSFNLKIDLKMTEKFLILFYRGYPTLATFKREFESEVWKRKYSSTVMGRKRYWENKTFFADYKEADKYESRVKREAFNHALQGSGADVTKLAMIKMFKENPFGDSFKLVLQIHDEIVVEVTDEIANEAEIFGKKCMVNVFQPFLGKIPAVVDSHIEQCWTK